MGLDSPPNPFSAAKATIPLPPPAIVSTEVAMMRLIIAPPALPIVRKEHGAAVHAARRDDELARQLAGHAHAHATWRRSLLDAPDHVLRGVIDRHIELAVARRVRTLFVLLVLDHMHAAPAGRVGVTGRRAGWAERARHRPVLGFAVGNLWVFAALTVPEDARLGKVVRVHFEDASALPALENQRRLFKFDPYALRDIGRSIGWQHDVREPRGLLGKRLREALRKFGVARFLVVFVCESEG